MANTSNFNLYKPNRADVNVEVDTSLTDNFVKIDTELKNNKDGLDTHKNDINAHTSDKIIHSDGSVKTALENQETRLGDLELYIESIDGLEPMTSHLVPSSDSFIYSVQQCNDVRAANALTTTFRIATFNILKMRTFDNYYIQKAKETINKSGANICVTQESFNGALFNYDSKMKSTLFPNTAFGQAVFKYTQGCNYGVGLLSATAPTQNTMTLYNMLGTGHEQRGFLRSLLNLNGVDLALYTTHLSFEDASLPPSQLSEVFTAMQADSVTHKILLGDFNTENLSLFSAFTSAGYTIQNNGTYKTFKPTSLAIDNIITSSNISVSNKGMLVSGDESDHNLFYADFKLM